VSPNKENRDPQLAKAIRRVMAVRGAAQKRMVLDRERRIDTERANVTEGGLADFESGLFYGKRSPNSACQFFRFG